jgi:hypothetical protein
MRYWVAGKLDIDSHHLVLGMKKKHEDLLAEPVNSQPLRGVQGGSPSKSPGDPVHVEDASVLIVEKHAENRDGDEMTASIPDKVLRVAVGKPRGTSVELGCFHRSWSRSSVGNLHARCLEAKQMNG